MTVIVIAYSWLIQNGSVHTPALLFTDTVERPPGLRPVQSGSYLKSNKPSVLLDAFVCVFV